MQLNADQRLVLAQRIADEFTGFVKEELQYQVEDMKDNDELSWDYFVQDADQEAVLQEVINLVSGVPVG